MQALPLFFNIKNRPCVVIGGGEIALRKITLLLKAEADVMVIALDLHVDLQVLLSAKKIKFLADSFEAKSAARRMFGDCGYR